MVTSLQEWTERSLAALAKVADRDQFPIYWAVDVLIWHPNGHAGNCSNFQVHRENYGLFEFWAVDGALAGAVGLDAAQAGEGQGLARVPGVTGEIPMLELVTPSAPKQGL